MDAGERAGVSGGSDPARSPSLLVVQLGRWAWFPARWGGHLEDAGRTVELIGRRTRATWVAGLITYPGVVEPAGPARAITLSTRRMHTISR